MLALRIVDWDELYEVNWKNREYQPGDKKRSGPLHYLRWQVHGTNAGPSWRRMALAAGPEIQPIVFGTYGKLVEIAADRPAEYRGWILDSRQRPIGVAEIAGRLGWMVEHVALAVEVMTNPDVRWLVWEEFPGESGRFRKVPGGSGISHTQNQNQNQRERGDSGKIREVPENTSGARVSSELGIVVSKFEELSPMNGGKPENVEDIFGGMLRKMSGERIVELIEKVDRITAGEGVFKAEQVREFARKGSGIFEKPQGCGDCRGGILQKQMPDGSIARVKCGCALGLYAAERKGKV